MNTSAFSSTVNNALNAPMVQNLSRQRDLIVVFGVVGVLIVMVIPIPPFLMDILLSLSLCLALVVLLVSMYQEL